MDSNGSIDYLQLLKLAVPELLVVLAALAVLGIDLLTLRGVEPKLRRIIAAMVCVVGCAASIAWMAIMPEEANFMGMLVLNPMTQMVKTAVLVLAILTVLLSVDTDFTPHVGEYFALLLLGAVGMMFLVSAQDILMIFVSLELTSLSLYILTGFNKRSVQSAEASLKYFLFGGVSAAITLFGLSLLYGLSGGTNLREIAGAIHGPKLDPLMLLAIVMTVAGFGFKVAAVPFHLWAPDAYQGAPAPSAAFIASGSKVASFFVFGQVMLLGFKGAEGAGALNQWQPGWVPVLALLAAFSMLVGNLAALAQTSVRRLLAYSSIAHAGYMLLGVMARGGQGVAPLVYYVVTYGLTTVGAFGVVSIVQQQTGGDRLADFEGFSRRSPVLAFCMLIFMLSLAGIPPLAGFFGKFYLFSAVLGAKAGQFEFLWLVCLALGLSAVSLYYYLQVLKRIYVVEPVATDAKFETPIVSEVVLALVALAVMLLGCVPEWLLSRLSDGMRLAGL